MVEPVPGGKGLVLGLTVDDFLYSSYLPHDMFQHGMELADMMVEPVPGGKGLATCLTVVLVLTGEMYVLHVLSEVALVLGRPAAQRALVPTHALVLVARDVLVKLFIG